MNTSQSSRGLTTNAVVQSLFCLWLICLSVFVVLGYQAMDDQTDQERLNSRLQHLEAQLTELAETTKALQQRPASATAAGLQDTRHFLEKRITQVEQVLTGHATADDVQALRTEVEQIKAKAQAASRTATPAKPRARNKPSPTVAKPETPPMLFRIVGAEMRAGQRSVSVTPSVGDFTQEQLRVLLPGDAIGPWRLQIIDGNTAVFLAGDQTRRVAIP